MQSEKGYQAQAVEPSAGREEQVVATREDVRRAFWAAFEIARMAPRSYDIDSHWRSFLIARESRGDTWMNTK